MSVIPLKKSDTLLERNISRDEMNLAEFPLAVLSTRVNSSIKTLEFEDSVTDNNGKRTKRSWIITGADKFGLPTSTDDEVLLGLMKLTVDNRENNQFVNRKVFFTRYELLKILKWTTEGRSYTRLQNALDRLSGVRIKATNAFFDNESKSHSTKNFGVIDSYEINDGRDAPKPSFFIWSEELFQSFQVGFIKKLDLDFVFNLKSAVSKRLYRYLDKRFWRQGRVPISLFTLAHEKIGISRNYKYASSLKQQLEPALVELTDTGFISKYEYQGRGKGTEIIIYKATAGPRCKEAKGYLKTDSTGFVVNRSVATRSGINKSVPDKSGSKNSVFNKAEDLSFQEGETLLAIITQKLIQRGLKPQQTENLLAEREDDALGRIEKILDYYDLLIKKESPLISRSPVGFLYRAVERPENFVLPEERQGTETVQAKTPGHKKANVLVGRFGGEKSEEEIAREKYEAEGRREVLNLRRSAGVEILSSLEEEVVDSLKRMRNSLSEERFQKAVNHKVDQKLLNLFAFPSFEEWNK